MCGAAIGATPDVLERVAELVKAQVDVLALDSAHGHNSNVVETVRKVKKAYPDVQLIAGNIATAEAAKALDRRGRGLHQGRHRPRLHLYHPCGGGYRRAPDHSGL